jgi:DNA-binding beta-propeller fold protein YncE
MALSEVDICNAALGQVGIDVVISALNDTSTREARKCNLYYPIARDELQELFPWNYVKKRAPLVRDGATYDPTTQVSDPQAVVFRPNGKVMYILSGSSVYQYTLSDAWDITTASYASKTFDFSTEEATPTGILFNPAGTKMYMVGTTDDIVEQYTLSTSWDVSTAVADAVQLDVSSEDTAPNGIVFGSSGLKLYIAGNTNNTIFEYTLTTAYDLSTATYASKSISVAVQETAPGGIAFNTGGTKMYVAGSQSDAVHQYTLSTAWDVSTATTDSVDFQVVDDDTGITDIFIDATGARIYLVGTENDYVYHYGMEVAYDLSTANGDNPAFGYEYQFVYPANALRILEVKIDTATGEPRHEMEGRRILSNEPKGLDAVYIQKLTDTDMFPPMFENALIFHLASKLAMALANDSNLKALLIAERDLIIPKAEQMTDREGKPNELPERTAWQKRGRFRRKDFLPPVDNS